MKPDKKHTDLKNIDEVLNRYLPSVPTEQMESDAARVLHHLRSMADQKADRAEGAGFADPDPASVSGWRRIGWVYAAAAVLVAALATTVQWRQSGGFAVVESVDGSLYQVVEGKSRALPTGDAIESDATIRTNGGGGAMLALRDGSRVEMRSQSELGLERADDGIKIRLRTGSIIVTAAKQPSGHLYVQTKDMTVSVTGTVFLVNAEDDGSRVAVIEGEVRVHEGTNDTKLRPGEQVSSSPKLAARTVTEEIAWSRQKDAHLATLAAFENGMAATAGSRAPLANTSGTVQAPPNQTGAAAAKQEFEEASVRPCDPDNLPPTPEGGRGGGANSFQMTPGRTHALCMTLATIIRTAYGYGNAAVNPGGRRSPLNANIVYGLGVEDGLRVRGGPDWVRSDRYTIDAVANGAADAETMSRPMLRSLLERRFRLQAHIETEQIPAFELTVASRGLKMREGTCTPPGTSYVQPPSTAELVRRNLDAARRGATTLAPCQFAGAMNGPNLVFVGSGAGVPSLGGVLGAQVIDRTGIPATARFNYALEFKPDERTAGPLAARLRQDGPDFQIAANPAGVPAAPDIFAALEDQLGLKLEPVRAPREFIVIDRVERLSPN